MRVIKEIVLKPSLRSGTDTNGVCGYIRSSKCLMAFRIPRKGNSMKKKETLVNIIMAVILSICMGALFTFINRSSVDPEALKNMPPAPIAYLVRILESVTVGVIISLIIPMGKWGFALAKKFGANPPGIKFTLINSIPFSLINAILLSFICSFIGIATSYGNIADPNKPSLVSMWLGNWIKTLPISIVVGYVLAIIISPIVVKAVGLGKPPAGAPGGPGGPPAGAPGGPGGPPKGGPGGPGGPNDRNA